MKYAWFCAHCGYDNLFTETFPKLGDPLNELNWKTDTGAAPQPDTRPNCRNCQNPMIMGAAYLRAVLPRV